MLRFEIARSVTMAIIMFWYRLIRYIFYRRLVRSPCIQLRGYESNLTLAIYYFTLKMEAPGSSEKFMTIYQLHGVAHGESCLLQDRFRVPAPMPTLS
jgi:hypothetical protein